MWRVTVLAASFGLACAAPPEASQQEAPAPASPMEGTFEYFGSQKGMAALTGGRFLFLYGPQDGSGPMTAEAGTYQIVRDTATHTVVYSTDSARIGLVYKWTPESWAGDTVAFVIMDNAGQITGRGRSIRHR